MTYLSDISAELALNVNSARPGKISRTHYAFGKGAQAYHMGRSVNDCEYLAGGEAARHWLAGWNDAAKQFEGVVID